ncbi:protein-arginine deiminase type-1-like [Spea bombifrons]|uniref:protein-arginine deiminase type-1-like n=1 Tax=Spea bombifrons TaxID=233779 RepID=UPI002349A8F7|nr:protein-arginine deiminase type-1-like [Spea bombifrons]
MSQVVLSSRRPTYGVCVVGNDTDLDIYRSVPSGADSFNVCGTSSIDVTIVYNPDKVEVPQSGGNWPLNKGVKVMLSCTRPSKEMNDSKVKVTYYGQKGKSLLGSSLAYLTCVDVSLNADVHRTGAVTVGEKDKGSWTWGPNGKGAILLVNCDRDKEGSGYTDSEDAGLPNAADIKDMSQMVLVAEGPEEFFDGHQINLHIERPDSNKLRVFCKGKSTYIHVLGGGKLSYKVERRHRDEILFYVEGLQFPDATFSGLVSVNLSLQETVSGMEIFTEKLAFRIAPWIMTPNTLKPLEVYVCSTFDNQNFVKQIKELTRKARCDLNIIPELKNRGDRWIQDEMELGYTEAPHKRFPVVFDSPRNRELQDFPFKDLLGPDFGYVTKEPENSGEINSLDSFGNLEVSPPVTVNRKEYPLGRILIGSGLPDLNIKMNKVVRDFLAAQMVQAPVELYSYWLTVGHIDEFMSFVPAPDQKGFRLLLASPRACLALFREKQQDGHGDAVMFEGKNNGGYPTIDDILSDDSLKMASESTQHSIDLNRKILKKELGLTESDIIDIPILYTEEWGTADAFFPNMVNMLVLGNYLGIPKPFGPVIDGKCCLEERARSLLEPLGLKCVFIDDYESYHLNLGEVHCGTNVLRKQFPAKWWECSP